MTGNKGFDSFINALADGLGKKVDEYLKDLTAQQEPKAEPSSYYKRGSADLDRIARQNRINEAVATTRGIASLLDRLARENKVLTKDLKPAASNLFELALKLESMP